jgi:hypothetical protein
VRTPDPHAMSRTTACNFHTTSIPSPVVSGGTRTHRAVCDAPSLSTRAVDSPHGSPTRPPGRPPPRNREGRRGATLERPGVLVESERGHGSGRSDAPWRGSASLHRGRRGGVLRGLAPKRVQGSALTAGGRHAARSSPDQQRPCSHLCGVSSGVLSLLASERGTDAERVSRPLDGPGA